MLVRIKKTSGTRRVYKNPRLDGRPFIAGMANGHMGIFQRKRDSEKIQELRTLSIPQMLGSKSVMEHIKSEESEKLIKKNLEREIKRILEGYF